MILDEITFGGVFKVAQLRFLKDDGGFHRECREPEADLSDLPEEARNTIMATWTREVIDHWKAEQERLRIESEAEAERQRNEPPPPPDPIRAELDALRAENAALRSDIKTLTDRVEQLSVNASAEAAVPKDTVARRTT